MTPLQHIGRSMVFKVRGTLSCLKPAHRHVSPAFGMLLFSSPHALANAYDAAALTRAAGGAGEQLLTTLFHHHVPNEV